MNLGGHEKPQVWCGKWIMSSQHTGLRSESLSQNKNKKFPHKPKNNNKKIREIFR
jgi:hypothetical protein